MDTKTAKFFNVMHHMTELITLCFLFIRQGLASFVDRAKTGTRCI